MFVRTCTDYTCTSFNTQSLYVHSDASNPIYSINGKDTAGLFQSLNFKSDGTGSIQFLQIEFQERFIVTDTSFTAVWYVTKRRHAMDVLAELSGVVTQPQQWSAMRCGQSTPVNTATSAFGSIKVHPYFNGLNCIWYISSSADIHVEFLKIEIGTTVSILVTECLDATCDYETGQQIRIVGETWSTESMLLFASVQPEKFTLHATTGFVRVYITAHADPKNANAALNGLELVWRLSPRTIITTTSTTTTAPPTTTTKATSTTTPPRTTTTTARQDRKSVV